MIYFDNAATTYPKPPGVISAVTDHIRSCGGNPGRGGHEMALRASESVYACRKKAARFFGVDDPSLVCFTGSCTEALNMAVRGIVGRGDIVLTSNAEHNSVRRPLAASGARIIKFNAFGRAEDILEEISDGIAAGAGAVVCTCASNVFPLVLPVSEIGKLCRSKGVLFIADGAQAAGVHETDVVRDCIDVLCIPAHKGLYGIAGCGALILSPQFDVSRMRPLLYGGSGINSKAAGMPELPPEKYEAGTLPSPAIAALSSGIDFVSSYGIKNIRDKEFSIGRRIFDFLSRTKGVRVYGGLGTLLCFNIENMQSERTADMLNSYGICARAGLHCAPDAHKMTAPDGTGAVRISFSVFNTEEEADFFCDAIKKIIRS